MRSSARMHALGAAVCALPLRGLPDHAHTQTLPPSSPPVISSIEGMTSTVMQHSQTSLAGIGLRATLQPASFPRQIALLLGVGTELTG